MKYNYLILILFWANAAICSTINPRLEYKISPILIEGKNMLQVSLNVKPNKKGITELAYENNFWGEENLFNCLKSIKTIENSDLILDKENGIIKIIHSKKLKELHIVYIIQQDVGQGLKIGAEYRPVITKNYFMSFGQFLFLTPKVVDDEDTKFDVYIEWEGFSENYVIHNSFSRGKLIQRIFNISPKLFLESIFVGGDYEIKKIKAKNKNVYLAMRGKWDNFSFDQLASVASEIVNVANDFWESEDLSYYTIILSNINIAKGEAEEYSTITGTALTNSFNAVATPNIEFPQSVLFHEYLHNWIGLTIKNTDGEEQYWFSEGFTEYYTAKLISKYKVNNTAKKEYISMVNEKIKKHWQSKVKHEPNSKITYDNFWGDFDYQELPYNRGFLFAFYLDIKINNESNTKFSLDDVMKELLRQAKQKDKKIKGTYFVKTVNKFLDTNIKDDFNSFITNGELIPLESFFKINNIDFNSSIKKIKRLGLEYDGDKIVKVIKGLGAEKAGFKVGDILIDYEKNPKAGSLAFYEVLRNGEPQKISVMRESEELKIPQIKNTIENLKKLKVLQ